MNLPCNSIRLSWNSSQIFVNQIRWLVYLITHNFINLESDESQFQEIKPTSSSSSSSSSNSNLLQNRKKDSTKNLKISHQNLIPPDQNSFMKCLIMDQKTNIITNHYQSSDLFKSKFTNYSQKKNADEFLKKIEGIIKNWKRSYLFFTLRFTNTAVRIREKNKEFTSLSNNFWGCPGFWFEQPFHDVQIQKSFSFKQQEY